MPAPATAVGDFRAAAGAVDTSAGGGGAVAGAADFRVIGGGGGEAAGGMVSDFRAMGACAGVDGDGDVSMSGGCDVGSPGAVVKEERASIASREWNGNGNGAGAGAGAGAGKRKRAANGGEMVDGKEKTIKKSRTPEKPKHSGEKPTLEKKKSFKLKLSSK
ncbi:MAG: hypothetical protein Q9157_004932 [Trypethelium eluteriae]